jgi:hypothetical protein
VAIGTEKAAVPEDQNKKAVESDRMCANPEVTR